MVIDGDSLIQKQVKATATTPVSFEDGRQTVLHPVTYVAQLADARMRLSLDGEWRVARWPFSAGEADLAAPETDDSTWETRSQPGKVFTQDTERPAASIQGWDRIGLAHIDPEDGAVLRRVATIPADWAGRRIYLAFDGIYPGGRVYLNGRLLGEHTSGLTPVEWDVTDNVAPGEPALVAVRLLRRHQFVKMDMPRHAAEFAGISQSAYFHATEPCQISTHHLTAAVRDDYANAALSGSVTLRQFGSESCSAELTISLSDPQAHHVAFFSARVALAAGSSADVTVTLNVPQPQLWNDEYPNLYTIRMSLQVDGQQSQSIEYRTGFRRFEFKDSRPLLNGRPVKFRGVNHLTHHPDFGLHTPAAWLRQCLTLMKRANVNCIRTHYLGPRVLADLCDELGMYLLQELPIDWGTDYIADPLWVGPALQRIHGGILRDRHHPSVMVWCIGNENMPARLAEAEDGANHLRIYDRFAKLLDPSRPTMFPPPGPTNTIAGILEVRLGDIADTHYSFKHIKGFLESGVVENPAAWDGGMVSTTREEALARGWSGVWFSSEYGIANLMPDLLHAPYGDIINDYPLDQDSGQSTLEVFTERLRREWGFMRDEPSCLGGAYFPWICGAAGDNPWGWTVWAEDNDWGVVTADLTPKPFFWAMRALFSPVWFPNRISWRPGETSIRFSITNQYNAIDLRVCKLRTMLSWGKSASTRDWRDIPVSCPPGESASVEIPLWEPAALDSLNQNTATVLRIVLLDPMGFRPITADIMITPDTMKKDERAELLIGPDVSFG